MMCNLVLSVNKSIHVCSPMADSLYGSPWNLKIAFFHWDLATLTSDDLTFTDNHCCTIATYSPNRNFVQLHISSALEYFSGTWHVDTIQEAQLSQRGQNCWNCR